MILIVLVIIIIYAILHRELVATRVYWFYSPKCGYCHKMKDEWNKVEKDMLLSMNRTVNVNIIEPKNQKLCDEYDVKTVPHIVKVKNGKRYLYTGNRTKKDIIQWINE